MLSLQKVGEKTLTEFNWDSALESAEIETPTGIYIKKEAL